MVQSYHQPCEYLELLFNKAKYESLPKDLQAIVKYAAMAQSADMTWEFYDRNSADVVELDQKRGVKFTVTPKAVLEAQLKAWDKVIGEESGKNAFFAKVIKSQRDWAQRAVPWRQKVGDTYGRHHRL